MKIGWSIIVKGDESLDELKKSAFSISSHVDKLYITTNGKNIEQIKKFCRKYGFVHNHIDWCDDFSIVRNFAFKEMYKDNYDYVGWIDSDDIFVGGEHLRNVCEQAKINNMDVVFFTYWYACTFKGEPSLESIESIDTQHMRERLFRPNTIVWKGRLHETPIPIEGQKHKYTQYPYDVKDRPIAVLHTLQNDDKAIEKLFRNGRILELQLMQERKDGEADPRTLLYLMKIYVELKEPQLSVKILQMGEEYLKKSGWNEERGTCCDLMAKTLYEGGYLKEAIEYQLKSIQEWPHKPVYYLNLAYYTYFAKDYKSAKHWLEVASKMDLDNNFTAGINNLKETRAKFADLMLKISYNVDKDVDKAVDAAKMLYKETPTEDNKKNLQFLLDAKDLNDACQNTHKLLNYLHSIGDDKSISKIIESLPNAISEQPFAIKIRQNVTIPRKWEKNEICYYANFHGKHFEKWDTSSLEKGIGGSETAVIELSKQWAKMGYKVTIYGDPIKEGEQDGTIYLPWYKFNRKDAFNIFIQWRDYQLAGKIKCNKFLVDLHDVFSLNDIKEEQLNFIDKFMVKSVAHRKLAPEIPDNKFLIVSNGIEL